MDPILKFEIIFMSIDSLIFGILKYNGLEKGFKILKKSHKNFLEKTG